MTLEQIITFREHLVSNKMLDAFAIQGLFWLLKRVSFAKIRSYVASKGYSMKIIADNRKRYWKLTSKYGEVEFNQLTSDGVREAIANNLI